METAATGFEFLRPEAAVWLVAAVGCALFIRSA